MRFTKLRFNGLTVVDFPIVGATPQDLYILKDVEGLGPPEVDVRIAKTLNAGGVYQGKRPEEREIVATVGLNPDYTAGQVPGDLRSTLYGLLTPGSGDQINVQIMDEDTEVAHTFAYISKMEPQIWTEKPAVQITAPCEQPYLISPNELFLEPESKTSPAIQNVGDAPAGIHLEMLFTTDQSIWSLTHSSGKKMEVEYAFLTGDLLEIDTRPGLRGIWVTHAGVRKNIIYALSSDSVWFMLHGGVNNFVTSSSSFDWGDVFYLPQFWGI